MRTFSNETEHHRVFSWFRGRYFPVTLSIIWDKQTYVLHVAAMRDRKCLFSCSV